jgi:hypothetical protein
MQKVVGSSPIIRSRKGPAQGPFLLSGTATRGSPASDSASVEALEP